MEILSGRDALNPVVMLQVPAHRFVEPGGKGLTGTPAELILHLAAIDSVAAIVAGTVGDKGDEAVVGRAGRMQAIEQRAEFRDNLHVGLLVEAADVVSLADAATLEHRQDRVAMVLNV